MTRKHHHNYKLYIIHYTFLLAVLLLNISCYSWFEDKVGMTDPSTNTLNDLFDTEVEVTELLPPSQLFVSQGSSSSDIELSWSSAANATSYRIEKAVVIPAEDGTFTLPTDDEYEILQKFVYTTTYTDRILTNPSYNSPEYDYLFFYRICSDNISKGLESSPFITSDLTPILDDEGNPTEKYDLSGVTTTSCCGWLLPAPTGLEAWKGKSTTEIQLVWNSVPNARYYKIYRGINSNGTSMEQIATVLGNTTTYTNTMIESEQGIEFYYKITAQLSTGVESAFSSLALGFSLKPGAPEMPGNVHTVNSLGQSTSSIEVAWEAVNYVPTKPTLELTYSLYRTSSVDSVYTLIKNQLPPNTTSFTDTSGLKSGIYYYYYIQAIVTDSATGEQIKSAFSESGPKDTSTPALGFLLSYPSNVEVVAGTSNTELYIRWTAAIGSDLPANQFKYNIYGSDNQDGPYDAILSKIEGTLQSDNYYQVTVAKKPFYKISTYSEAANLESDLSGTVAPCPDAPTNIVVSKNAKIGGADFVANSLGVYPVKITWSKPDSDNPAGYHVYRSTKPDSDFRKVTTTPVQELSYIDKNETAKAANFYYYKVVSVNILGQGKYGNNPEGDANARGYGMLTPVQFFREYNKTVMGSQKKLTLMHKTPDPAKIGKETINGDISGTLYYEATMSLPANIIMKYTDYCDAYILGDSSLGKYMTVNGNTDTQITDVGNRNGTMLKSTEVTGMYLGTVDYNKVQIKGGAAGGGVYVVTTKDSSGTVVENSVEVDWKIGEEGRK